MSDFEKELRALMKRYGVIMVIDDHYDGEDEYIGSSCCFVGDGVSVECESLAIDVT